MILKRGLVLTLCARPSIVAHLRQIGKDLCSAVNKLQEILEFFEGVSYFAFNPEAQCQICYSSKDSQTMCQCFMQFFQTRPDI